MILASKNMGVADPPALKIAVAAEQGSTTDRHAGGPDRARPMPRPPRDRTKSNAAYLRRSTPRRATSARVSAGAVPAHLRDSHYAGTDRLGHGRGYRYSHDDPRSAW